ncbi:hypothetical protein [Falsiroseomonas sp. E2-1-a20]|uniref:hypothetical protein n=1 Tax=Falsiroseomonas sp. E2-1-a20 TaxID=3239300 RepID=UPI003F3B845F
MQGVIFRPTEEQHRSVRAMAGYGVPHADIATMLDIDAKTLRKHFRRDPDRGSIEATTKVAQTLFGMATSGHNTAAAIFWMKARAGWREKHDVRVEVDDVRQLSDEVLEERVREGLKECLEVAGYIVTDPVCFDAEEQTEDR